MTGLKLALGHSCIVMCRALLGNFMHWALLNKLPSACQVEAMSGLWEAQLVVAACALPEPLAAALLRAGAKAVVCRRAPGDDPVGSTQPSPEAAVTFFEVRAF